MLIIASSCALGRATPMSVMAGVGHGAQAGVLIKNAEALERMERIDALVVDKIGTLTEGKRSVTAIVTHAGFYNAKLLRLAAGVESASEHPLVMAIVALRNQGIRIVMLTGDNRTAAASVGGQLGIEEVEAEICLTRNIPSSMG